MRRGCLSGLHDQCPISRVVFLKGDLSRDQLGLEPEGYVWLESTVIHVIHNAWPVDFNRHFSSFKPSICGVQNLIKFARNSANSARIFFVSSISPAGNWGTLPGARLKVPEAELDDWKVTRLGYGQANLVSERLLVRAAQGWNMTSAVCRVGQVAGPVLHGEKGAWPKQEWLPSLVASSMAMGLLPKNVGL